MGTEFIAQPLDEFATPFRVTAAELVSIYGVEDPTVPAESSERAIMVQSDARASTEARVAYAESHPETRRAKRRADQLAEAGLTEGPPEGSPEAFFARQGAPDA
jgi:hypothetical protein